MPVAEPTQPQIMSLSASGAAGSGMRSEVVIRDFAPIVIDEPPALGGRDAGANPMEYVLASLIGCASVMIRLIAQEIGFSYADARFEVQGELDLRGLMGEPGISPHFSQVTGDILLDTSETQARVQELMDLVESRCPVFNMLRDAGTRVDIAWAPAG
jgi:uncharacterized OsmC-like protein